jgi:hypothetical protein
MRSMSGGTMKYVLLFCGTPEDQAAFDALSREDLAERYARVGRWFAEHASVIGASNYLQPRETATTVRLDGGDPLVIDGPFLEGNELIGGYAEIDVADLDAALAIAKEWPGGGAVEIRPAVQHGG